MKLLWFKRLGPRRKPRERVYPPPLAVAWDMGYAAYFRVEELDVVDVEAPVGLTEPEEEAFLLGAFAAVRDRRVGLTEAGFRSLNPFS